MKKEKAPILIMDASSQPYLSVGRHFGGVKAYGSTYVYVKTQDAFVREDFMKQYQKSKSWDEFLSIVSQKESHL